ncbi:MAG TPA: VCBS repeat-containing protein [Planctomycetota bacterium]|nr:VCBS repeat-containing protein [Planctomycetota bacterium]
MKTAPGSHLASVLALGLLLLRATPVAAQEPPVFSDMAVPVAAGLDSRALTSGDIDADGLADIALVRITTAMVWRGTPDGLSPTFTLLGTAVTLRTGRLADLDDDGRADLILLPETQPEALVAWSQGDGTFTAFDSIALPTHGGAVAVADVTGDGHADLLVSHFGYERLAVVPGLGDRQFGPEFDTHDASSSFRLDLGDIDADGVLDLLSNNIVDGLVLDISISHGLGSGLLAPPTQLYFGVPNGRAVLIDADLDGLDDVAQADGSASLKLFAGQPDGSVASPVPLAAPRGVVQLAVGDFTGDALPDLLAAKGGGIATVTVLKQAGAGLVSDSSTAAFAYDGLADLGAADVDGDGVADAIGRQALTESVEVLIAQQAGGFRNGYIADATQRDAVVLDLDGDGRPDLLSAVDATPSGRLRAGQLNGAFGVPTALDLGVSPSRLFAGDVEPDGDVDVLVVQDLLTPGARWLLNDGSGNLRPQPTTSVPGVLRDVAADDLDGDGRLDLALATSDPSAVVPLLSTAGAGFAVQPAVPLDFVPFKLATGDFDGASWHDLAVGASTHVTLVQLQPPAPPVFTSIDTGSSLRGVVLGNFDGDGLGDILAVVLTGNHTHLVWYEEDGNGVPTTVGNFDLGLGTAYEQPLLGDADGDGDGELVLAGTNGDFNSVAIVLGTSGGPPTIDEEHPLPEAVLRLALADANGDGALDLQAVGDVGSAVLFLPSATPRWERLGHSLAGGAGLSRLEGVGPLLAGDPVALRVEGALPDAAGVLVLGTSVLSAPFKGGVLVPEADLLLAGLLTDAAGAFSLVGRFPPGVPSGAQLAAQMWFPDSAAPQRWSASWGVVGTAP